MCQLVPVAVGLSFPSPGPEQAGSPELPPGISGSWQIVPPATDLRGELYGELPSEGTAAAAGGVQPVSLRCWLALPRDRTPRSGVLVLPEVFGINGWVRSVAARLAGEGYAALAVPLFARTAPELELGYDEASLALGRSHKDQTEAATLLVDVAQAAGWLAHHLGDASAPLGCVGFCFGGHVAMLAASLPCIAASVDCYGAGVVSGRPGGGPPTLELLPQIRGHLLCLCGEQDPLLPEADVQAMEAAIARCPHGDRHRLIRMAGAGHGYLCEARADYHPEAAARSWPLLLQFLAECLPQPG